jgi:hypothetical protein
MITITMTTSSPKAIELAKKMLASKKETEKEMRAYRKTPEYKLRVEELMKKIDEKNNGIE